MSRGGRARAGRAGRVGAALVALAVGCAAPIRIATDHDPSADLAALRGWSWFAAPAGRGGDPRLDDPLLDARIRRAVEAELSIRGYPRTVGLDPDFLVTYHYEEGTLLLDFLDPRSRRRLWRGSAQARVERDPAPDEREASIREAVRLMLERFPPARERP